MGAQIQTNDAEDRQVGPGPIGLENNVPCRVDPCANRVRLDTASRTRDIQFQVRHSADESLNRVQQPRYSLGRAEFPRIRNDRATQLRTAAIVKDLFPIPAADDRHPAVRNCKFFLECVGVTLVEQKKRIVA